jgi:hypothetical protein
VDSSRDVWQERSVKTLTQRVTTPLLELGDPRERKSNTRVRDSIIIAKRDAFQNNKAQLST